MILTEREQRILAETGRQLAATDPRFARAMRRGASSATVWTRTGCAAVTVLACLSAVLCVALSLIGPAIVAVMLGIATHYLRTQLALQAQHASDRSRCASQ
jgi:hypothetical protein